MNRKTTLWITLLTFIFLGFAPGLFAQTEQAPKADAKPLPNLVLNTIDGQKWSLYENRGRVVILNFWATWCEPCRTETPMLVKLAGEYEEAGLKVVGIALDEDTAELIKNSSPNTKSIIRFCCRCRIRFNRESIPCQRRF